MAPDLTLILVNWNTRALLLQSLRALPAATGDLRTEIIVVDNASTDGSVEALAQELAPTQVICNDRNVGFATANNQALRIAAGRYALLLNTDTVPQPDSIRRLVAFADAQPRAGMVGAMLLNPDGTFQASYADFPSLHGETLLLLGLARKIKGPHFPNHGPSESRAPRRCDWVQGACLLVRREALRDVGFMDEGYFMYTEETDWCAQCWKAGWEVWYTPDAQVVHYGGQSTAKQPAAKRRMVYFSKVRFFRKQRGALAAIAFSAIIQATSALKLMYWLFVSALSRDDRHVTARTNVQAYLAVMGLSR